MRPELERFLVSQKIQVGLRHCDLSLCFLQTSPNPFLSSQLNVNWRCSSLSLWSKQCWSRCGRIAACPRLTIGQNGQTCFGKLLAVSIQSNSWLVVPWQLLDAMNLVKFQHTPGRKKRRWNIGTTKYSPKAPINKNQCEPMSLAVMHASRHHWMFHHYPLLLVRNTSYLSLPLNSMICRYL